MKIADGLRQENEPTIIYSICRFTAMNQFNKIQVMSLFSDPKDNQKIAMQNLKFCEDCGFIRNDGQMYECMIPKESLTTYEKFVDYISLQVFKENNKFTQLTQWFLRQKTQVSKYSVEDITSKAHEVVSVDKNYVRGWQWWMLAFGLGTISSYIKVSGGSSGSRYIFFDCSEAINRYIQQTYSGGELIKIKQFLIQLMENKREFFGTVNVENDGNVICESISTALRVLHNMNVIELIYTPDSAEIWHMTESYSHKIAKDVTEIKILRGRHE